MSTRRPPARALRALGVGMTLYVAGRGAVLLWVEGVAPPSIAAQSTAPGVSVVAREAAALFGKAAGIAARSAKSRLTGLAETPSFAGEARYYSAGRRRNDGRPSPAVSRGDSISVSAKSAAASPLRLDVATQAQPTTIAMSRSADATDVYPVAAQLPADGRRRFAGSAWLLTRSGSGATAAFAPGGTLGGSQTGARLYWRPISGPGFLTFRGSAALGVKDRELAPGMGVSRGGAGLILEQRFSLEGARASETAIVGYAGVSEVKAPLGLRLDGYVQAGMVGLKRRALFVDGAVRAERPVATLGPGRLGGGAAIWGAAQPGAARFDAGPQAVLHLAGLAHGARVSAEYRFRLAGDARPPSGPSLTLGVDF